jgi:hypothetical protein
MDIVQIILGITVAVISISLLMMAGFALKNVFTGKHEITKLIAVSSPFIIFGVSMGVMGDSAEAGIVTTFVMGFILIAFILFTGLRKSFNF